MRVAPRSGKYLDVQGVLYAGCVRGALCMRTHRVNDRATRGPTKLETMAKEAARDKDTAGGSGVDCRRI